MTDAAWEPDDEIDRDLLAARRGADTGGFLTHLARADLLLPQPADAGQVSWATAEISGRRWVLSFTSATAMKGSLGADPPHRVARFPELAATWPDPALGLAANPGLPIEAYLSAEGVVDLAAAASRPATELERALAAALEGEDLEAYARALLETDVVVPVEPAGGPSRELTGPAFPWLRLDEDGSIVVFTSAARLRDQLGVHPHVGVAFADLVQVWPDTDSSAAIDPGTTYAGLLAGAVIGYLGRRVGEIERIAQDALAQAGTRTDLTGPERMQVAEWLVRQRLGQPVEPAPVPVPVPVPVPISGPVVQVVVPAGQVDRYLTHRHRRVAGLIHRQPPDNPPLAVLYERLGLLGDGSPFGPDDDVGYLLRWREPDPTAYPVPAMEGLEVPDGASLWRIDRDGEERRLATYRSAMADWSPESAG
jgi:hypothetical protein